MTGEKARVAFRLNGGLGTYLMEMNFIQYFFDRFPDSLEISVFSFSQETSLAVYGEQYFAAHYGPRSAFVPRKYDLAVELNWFPQVLCRNEAALAAADDSGELSALVQQWVDFADSERTRHFFTPDTNMFDPSIHTFAMARRQNRLQVADIDGSLGITNHFRLAVPVEQEAEALAKFGLADGPYLTLQQGVDAACRTKYSPKQWPNEYYAALCRICHQRFPQIKLVQLGEEGNNLPIEGVDVCLLGQTSLPELKAVLKNAVLHIDGDCGMVHLRRALHAGPSIVLYGNLPDSVYGYAEDYHMKSDACKHPCAKLFDGWKRRCYRLEQPVCMTSIQPQQVADVIGRHLAALERGELAPDQPLPESTPAPTKREQLLADSCISLDPEWVENWLMEQEIYEYHVEEVPLSELRFSKLTSQGYLNVPLSRAPAYQYLEGDTGAYDRYMQLHEKYHPDSERDPRRFQALLDSLGRSDYDSSSIIVVTASYQILDGAHRASWLLHQHGPDYRIKVLKLYGPFGL